MAKSGRMSGLAGLREVLAPLRNRISWSRPTPQSDLRYTILPPYEIPQLIVVTGLIVENHGSSPAHNVRITISYAETSVAMIHHMQVMSDEDYILRSGGEEYSFATIRLREMAPDSKVFVYLATADTVMPQVTVSSFEKRTK